MGVVIDPQLLNAFGLNQQDYYIEKTGSGHINYSYYLQNKEGDNDFLLQRINTNVFRDPLVIANNIHLAAEYLEAHHPDYLFIKPIKARFGEDLLELNNEYWRLTYFVKNTVALDKVSTTKQAYEAARQFGRLANYLTGINLREFRPAIPNFHNLTLRYSSFQDAVHQAREERREFAEDLIETFLNYSSIAITFEELKMDSDFPDRLMHHDTKINNVLLDEQTFNGICVVDLDTLMPGKIISDIGDMVRTYVSPVGEEERDFSKIDIREEYYAALMQGYLSEMGDKLTQTEKEMLFYAGQFMIYMQGIRFLTDFLNGDVYYPIRYPEHNYNRAKNQLTLLEKLQRKEKVLKDIISKSF